MKFSQAVEKYYNNKRYQFRNIKSDDNKDVIVKIDPTRIRIIEQEYYGKPCMVVDFNSKDDLLAVVNVIREIEKSFINIKTLIKRGRIYFNKVKRDFNAIHFRSLCYCNGMHKIIVDPITLR